MKNMKKAVFLFIVIFMVSLVALYAETQRKTDFKIGAKIIGVADPDYKEFSYIDMGSAHGVKPGDRFMVEGKYGKVMVEVVQSFQRMSSIKIVDSWLLNEGNPGEMIPSSRYPKIRIAKYVEKSKKDTVLSVKKTTHKKSKPKVSAKIEKTPKVEKTLPEEVAAEALMPEESAEVVIPSFEGIPEEQGVAEFPVMEAEGAELLTEIPGEEMPVGELETAIPGEEALPVSTEFSMEELGIPADTGMDIGLPVDTGMESDLPVDPGLPVDTDLTEPDLPSDDLSIMPGDALPQMP